MNYLEDLAGKTIASINPMYAGEGGAYLIKVTFTDNTVLRIDRGNTQEHWLEWKIKEGN